MLKNDNNYEFDNTQYDGMSVSGVDNVTKKGKKKAAMIGGISAAVIIGGSAAAYGFSDTVKNQVKLRLSKPEKYYAWVTENNSENFAKQISDKYREQLEKRDKGQNVKMKVLYAPSDDAKDKFLKNAVGDDYKDTDDENDKQLVDIVNKHDEYAISADCLSKDGKVSTNLGVDLSGDRVMSFEAAMELDAFDFFFRIPELKEQWIGLNVDVEDELSDLSSDETIDAFKDIFKDPASYMTPDELENEINKYAHVWTDFADEVSVEKKETVDICDVGVDYTVATVTLTEKDIIDLGIKTLNEVRDDKYVKDVVANKLDLGEDKFEEAIDNAIDELNDQIEEGDFDDEEVALTVDTYIDFTGTIRGLKFTSDEEDELIIAVGMTDDSLVGEFTVKESGEETISAKLSVNDYSAFKAGEKQSGDIVITGEDIEDEVKVEFMDFCVENEEKGYFSGDFIISVPDVDPVKISFNSNGKKQEIAYELRFDDVDYGKLALEYSIDYDADVTIPSENDAYMVSTDDTSDFKLEDYASKDEFSKFIKSVVDKIGFSGDTAEELADEITEDIYDEVDYALEDDDYDWDDDDYDDDDYDWDDDYEFKFDRNDYNYDDYKDFMTKEEFEEFLDEMESYYAESEKKAS